MSYYGYDPAAYRTDFSRFGSEIGGALSSLAGEFTELIKHNKLVKENNKYKEQAFSAVNQYVDELDSNTLSNVVSSLGAPQLIGEDNDTEARSFLKKMIPQYTDNMKPEDYDVKLANGFFVPYMRAAQSKAGGGSLDFSKMFSNLRHGGVQTAVEGTSIGKETIAGEKEQRQYDLDVTRAEEQEQKQYELGQTREKEEDAKIGTQVSNILNSSRKSIDVWKNDDGGTLSKEAKDKAYSILKAREDDELSKELKRLQAQLVNTRKEKVVSSDKFNDIINDYDRVLNTINDDYRQLDKYKDEGIYDDRQYKLEKQRLDDRYKEINALRKIASNAKLKFIKGGGGTQKQFESSMLAGEQQYKVEENNRKVELEQQLINDYNSGKYRKLFASRDAEKQKFIEDYKRAIGQEPSIEAIEKAVPSLSKMQEPQTSNNTRGDVDYAKVARAKRIANHPDATPQQKKNAENYLRSVGQL